MLPLSQKTFDRDSRKRVVLCECKDGEITKITHTSVRKVLVSVEDEDQSTQIKFTNTGMEIFQDGSEPSNLINPNISAGNIRGGEK